MANFVHLTPEKYVNKILRAGIHTYRVRAECGTGIYAMPVIPNFYTSHQWLRELKRDGQRTYWGIYFRLDDDDMVSIGHYNQPHITVSAAEATGLLMHTDDVGGYEVIIPHGIEPKMIYRAKYLPQIVGWRYAPNARNYRPCACPVCLPKGEINSQRRRERLRKAEAAEVEPDVEAEAE